MTVNGTGLLAIWSTVAADVETDYLHWLTREHVFERVGIPGFSSGRVFRRRGSAPSEYLILYELAHAEIMGSLDYQARLNQPTPWTQRIMPVLQQFRRGGGTIVKRAGSANAFGTCLAVARFDEAIPAGLKNDASPQGLAHIATQDRVVNTYLMEVSADGTRIATKEKTMRRGGEGIYSGILAIETLDDVTLAKSISASAASLSIPEATFEQYDLIFSTVKR